MSVINEEITVSYRWDRENLPVISVSVIGTGIDRKIPLGKSGPNNFVRYKRVSDIYEIY